MEQKLLFELKDLRPQLSAENLKTIEHIIYHAKVSKTLQEVNIDGYDKTLIICPSGKIMFKPEKQVCPECGNSSQKGE